LFTQGIKIDSVPDSLKCDNVTVVGQLPNYDSMPDAKQHTKSAHLDLLNSIIRNHKSYMYSNTTSTV